MLKFVEKSISTLRVEGEIAFFVVVVTHEVSKDLVLFSKFEDQSNKFFSCKRKDGNMRGFF